MGRLIDLFYNKYNYTDFHELNLSWLLKVVKQLLIEMDNMDEWKAQHIEEYDQLKKLYDDIVSGNFPDAMEDALKDWTVENSVSIIGELIKSIFVNLNDDGYIVFFIPDSWEDIVFGTTGLDTFPAGIDYGHLTLNY